MGHTDATLSTREGAGQCARGIAVDHQPVGFELFDGAGEAEQHAPRGDRVAAAAHPEVHIRFGQFQFGEEAHSCSSPPWKKFMIPGNRCEFSVIQLSSCLR